VIPCSLLQGEFILVFSLEEAPTFGWGFFTEWTDTRSGLWLGMRIILEKPLMPDLEE